MLLGPRLRESHEQGNRCVFPSISCSLAERAVPVRNDVKAIGLMVAHIFDVSIGAVQVNTVQSVLLTISASTHHNRSPLSSRCTKGTLG